MQIVPMRELKNTVEIERRCAEENGDEKRLWPLGGHGH